MSITGGAKPEWKEQFGATSEWQWYGGSWDLENKEWRDRRAGSAGKGRGPGRKEHFASFPMERCYPVKTLWASLYEVWEATYLGLI